MSDEQAIAQESAAPTGSAILARLLGVVSLRWLTGPIFDKEMRIASRRRRHYLLRFAYLTLLALFVVGVWLSTVRSDVSAHSVYRMSTAGKHIIATICWFQFCTLQLVAVVLLSGSISDEIHHRTLATLMTTPINSLQIVAGKLLSKLLHLSSLLLVTLPLLAIVRVFGGVPWDFLLASVCMTLTASMFAGAVAMFYSTLFRRAYASVLTTLATGFALYWLIPMILMILVVTAHPSGRSGMGVMEVLAHANPFGAMVMVTIDLLEPGGRPPIGFFSWPVHCLVMLAATIGLVLLCMAMVRRAALRKAFGGVPIRLKKIKGAAAPPPPPLPAASVADGGLAPVEIAQAVPVAPPVQVAPPPLPEPPAQPTKTGRIRSIHGSPLIWRKLRSTTFPGLASRVTALVLFGVAAFVIYYLAAIHDTLDNSEVQVMFSITYTLFGLVATCVFAATSISSEKEARSLPILLTTPVSDWHILAASGVETIRRTLPIWCLLWLHLLIFVMAGYLLPRVLLHMGLMALGAGWLLTCSGLYLSSRLKRTSTSVAANMGVGVGLWLILPILLALFVDADPAEAMFDFNPVIQAYVLVDGACPTSWRSSSGMPYDWPSGNEGPATTTWMMLGITAVYLVVGLLFVWRAKAHLRRRAF